MADFLQKENEDLKKALTEVSASLQQTVGK